jgi:hypothetical protein
MTVTSALNLCLKRSFVVDLLLCADAFAIDAICGRVERHGMGQPREAGRARLASSHVCRFHRSIDRSIVVVVVVVERELTRVAGKRIGAGIGQRNADQRAVRRAAASGRGLCVRVPARRAGATGARRTPARLAAARR